MKQRWDWLVPVGAIATVILITKPWSHVATLKQLWQQRQQRLDVATAPSPSPPQLGSIRGQVVYDANGNGQSDQQATVIYTESFEELGGRKGRRDRPNADTLGNQSITNETVTPAWSNAQTTAIPSEAKGLKRDKNKNQILGFLGGVNADGDSGQTTLILDKLPPHHSIELTFDLWIVGSWDGNLDANFAPDLWELRQGPDELLLRTAFSNIDSRANSQSYPLAYPAGQVAPRTNASAIHTLPQASYGDSTYRIRQHFAHNDAQLTLQFSGQGKTSLADDERWGLDNLTVTLWSGEAGISNVIVFLDQNQNGVRDPAEPFTQTDADGHYQFQGLVAGSYHVRVEEAILPGNDASSENKQDTKAPSSAAKDLTIAVPSQDIQILEGASKTVIFLKAPSFQ